MTRRCKWCIARIGSARLFLEGEWRVAVPRQGEVVTDGICPDCFAEVSKEIQARRKFPAVIKMAAAACLILCATMPLQASVDAPRLADAIKIAEGSRHPYGILSVHVSGEAEARRVCLNTIRHGLRDWPQLSDADFILRLADRYCPPSADAIGNRNWKKNVSALYFKAKK